MDPGIDSVKDDFKSEFFDGQSGIGNVLSNRMTSQGIQRGISFHGSEFEGDAAPDLDIEELASLLGIEKQNFNKLERIFSQKDEVKQ